MTLNGAIKQLHELRCNEDMPVYLKPAIAEVINVLLMDVQEVLYGHWVGIDDFPHETWECNRCGRIIEGDRENYCPNCGSRMVDEE